MNEHLIWLLEILGIVITVGGAYAVVSKAFNPIKQHSKDIEKNSIAIKENSNKIDAVTDFSNMMCLCMIAIMDHLITGNSIENLKQTRKTVNEFLVQKEKIK